MIAIIACPPVDTSELIKAMPELAPPEPHPGSTEGACEVCEQKIWIGPNQQELVAVRAEELKSEIGDSDITYAVVCFFCAMAVSHLREAAGTETQVRTVIEEVDL